MSPRLFAAYVEDIVHELKASEVLCMIGSITTGAILYADDLALVMLPKAKAALAICSNCASKWEIFFTPDKTGCVQIGKQELDTQTQSDLLKLANQPIKLVDSLKYLGVWIDKNFNSAPHFSKKRESMMRTLYGL